VFLFSALFGLAFCSKKDQKNFLEVHIPGTEIQTIHSVSVNQTFSLFVSLPEDYRVTTKTYPVLFMLDANSEFGIVTQILRLMRITKELPDMVVVGIGYPEEKDKIIWALRSRDLTPTPDPEYDKEMQELYPDMPDIPSGGAPRFLKSLTKEVIPLILSRYRIKTDSMILAGHSLGGLFALYTLFTQPNAFSHYIIGSPSIWWDSNYLFSLEEEYAAAHDDLPAFLFLSVGGEESGKAPYAMVPNMKKMEEKLRSRNYPNLHLETKVFEEETHMSVIPVTFSRGLRSVHKKSKGDH
jgi:predicted alpha/beta superfamily hydrolase